MPWPQNAHHAVAGLGVLLDGVADVAQMGARLDLEMPSHMHS
jgi:hypothetical protein